MIAIKKTIKKAVCLLLALSAALFGALSYGARAIPEQVSGRSGDQLPPLFRTLLTADGADAAQTCEIRFLQVFPVKTVSVAETRRQYVTVGGELIGIRLQTEGVTVVGTEGFETEDGEANPAADAGIFPGDILIKLDGKAVRSNKTLTALIEKSGGKPMQAELEREGERLTCTLTPRRSAATGLYKCGLWVRDSTAGIGTLTFSDTASGRIAALGHAICDTDTGQTMRVMNGGVYTAHVTGITKGAVGKAGEIAGRIDDTQLGTVEKNCSRGVYGTLSVAEGANDVYPVADAGEVHRGSAQIVCTVTNGEKKTYDVEITRINAGDKDDRNMTVKVTDTALLAETGGIVQGMSGSPILQDGMLVGAVTHVFVNDPKCGYAIFAETMLEEARAASG